MSKHLRTEKGMSIVECVIALLLTATAVISLVEMQSLAWRGAGKSDYLGRAQALLQRELERCEYSILRSVDIPADTKCMDQYGNDADCGAADAVFTINYLETTPATIPTNTRLLNVKITWPGSKSGIRSSIIVLPQSDY